MDVDGLLGLLKAWAKASADVEMEREMFPGRESKRVDDRLEKAVADAREAAAAVDASTQPTEAANQMAGAILRLVTF